MMILPETTFSPPNRFTPRRCPALSRPLWLEPPPFLCAISFSSLSSLTSERLNFVDPQPRVRLTMTALFALALLGLVVENHYLPMPALGDNRGPHRCARHQGH